VAGKAAGDVALAAAVDVRRLPAALDVAAVTE
jgi:hypothetical protein